MTERERWTVYPLLFLALGVALKDKMVQSVNTKNVQCNAVSSDSVQCKTIICNELLVTSPGSNKQVRLGSGEVFATGDMRAPTLICKTTVIAGADGKEAVIASSNDYGGFVQTTGSKSGVRSFLGNAEQTAGLLFVDPRGAVHRALTFDSPASAKKPRESEPAAESETPANEKANAAEPAADEAKNSPAEDSEKESAEQPKTTPEQPKQD